MSKKPALNVPISPNPKPSQRCAERIISEFLHNLSFASKYRTKPFHPINLAIPILARAYQATLE